ncbi:unnamed protein product [Symbiodinium sp. KB8]|nr:unnamed protein product [Symbiodinium sp. KB8]
MCFGDHTYDQLQWSLRVDAPCASSAALLVMLILSIPAVALQPGAFILRTFVGAILRLNIPQHALRAICALLPLRKRRACSCLARQRQQGFRRQQKLSRKDTRACDSWRRRHRCCRLLGQMGAEVRCEDAVKVTGGNVQEGSYPSDRTSKEKIWCHWDDGGYYLAHAFSASTVPPSDGWHSEVDEEDPIMHIQSLHLEDLLYSGPAST